MSHYMAFHLGLHYLQKYVISKQRFNVVNIASHTYSKDVDDNSGKNITLLDPVDRLNCVFS